jgi:hypothetical protein
MADTVSYFHTLLTREMPILLQIAFMLPCKQNIAFSDIELVLKWSENKVRELATMCFLWQQ